MGSTSTSKMPREAEVLKAFLYLRRKKKCLERGGLVLAPLILYNSEACCTNMRLNFLNANDFQFESRVQDYLYGTCCLFRDNLLKHVRSETHGKLFTASPCRLLKTCSSAQAPILNKLFAVSSSNDYTFPQCFINLKQYFLF